MVHACSNASSLYQSHCVEKHPEYSTDHENREIHAHWRNLNSLDLLYWPIEKAPIFNLLAYIRPSPNIRIIPRPWQPGGHVNHTPETIDSDLDVGGVKLFSTVVVLFVSGWLLDSQERTIRKSNYLINPSQLFAFYYACLSFQPSWKLH